MTRFPKSQFPQDRRPVAIQFRRGAAGFRIFMGGELDRVALHADGADVGVERLHDHVAGEYLRVLHHLGDVVQRPAGDAGGFEQ